jgi:hypothetical protein
MWPRRCSGLEFRIASQMAWAHILLRLLTVWPWIHCSPSWASVTGSGNRGTWCLPLRVGAILPSPLLVGGLEPRGRECSHCSSGCLGVLRMVGARVTAGSSPGRTWPCPVICWSAMRVPWCSGKLRSGRACSKSIASEWQG